MKDTKRGIFIIFAAVIIIGLIMLIFTCFRNGNNDGYPDNELPPTHSLCEHSLTYYEAVEASCTQNGNIEYWRCTFCGECFSDSQANNNVLNVIILSQGHNSTYHKSVDATCTEEGSLEYWNCSNCNKMFADPNASTQIYNELVEKTPHMYDDNNKCIVCEKENSALLLSYMPIKNGTEYGIYGIGNCTDSHLVIPKTYNGLPITKIEAHAFLDCTSITSVTLSDNITAVGTSAFQGCTKLKSVVIGSGLETIDNYTFSGCTGLKNITLSDNIANIRDHAFENCSNLETFDFSQGVNFIGESAFLNCSSLTNINIQDHDALIEYGAFSGCGKIESFTGPARSTSHAFGYIFGETHYEGGVGIEQTEKIGYGGYVETTYFVPENLSSVTVLGYSVADYAFSKCTMVTSLTIDSSVVNIGVGAFSGCQNLSNLIIGNGVKTIGQSAFSGCSSLESVTIPDNVTELGHYIFHNCTSLKNVIIGSGISEIYPSTFEECPNLSSVNFVDTTTWYRTDRKDFFVLKEYGTQTDVNDSEKMIKFLTEFNFYWYKLD